MKINFNNPNLYYQSTAQNRSGINKHITSKKDTFKSKEMNKNVSFSGLEFFIKDLRGFFTKGTDRIGIEEETGEKRLKEIEQADKHLAESDRIKNKSNIVLYNATKEIAQLKKMINLGKKVGYRGEVNNNKGVFIKFYEGIEDETIMEHINSNGKIFYVKFNKNTKEISEISIQTPYQKQHAERDFITLKWNRIAQIRLGNRIIEDGKKQVDETYTFENDELAKYKRNDRELKGTKEIELVCTYRNGEIDQVIENIQQETKGDTTRTKVKGIYTFDNRGLINFEDIEPEESI